MFHVHISEAEYPPSRRYSRLPLPSLSLSVLLSHSVTSLVSPYLSLAVLLACLSLRSLSTSVSYPPRCLLPWAVLPYLPDRSLDYINRIFQCRRQFGGQLAVFWPPLRVWPSTSLV